jgi:MYXO-CTERM domain-containing protein
MRSRLALAAASALAACTLFTPRPAAAGGYDVLAQPCGLNPLTCGLGGVKFEKSDTLPIQWSFDTGWVPQGSPLQVHLWADVWANTHVNLAGSLQNAWPTAMMLEAPGNKEGGQFGFHYGADFGAQGKITISVLGKSYSWQGDLPYLPQFDLEVQADKTFDAWGFDPGVKISGQTTPQKIAQVSIGDIVGGSIPGIDGGFELDVAVELAATYKTDRVVLGMIDGADVTGGPITSEGGTSAATYVNGPNLEIDIHPEGTVNYDGIVHLIPAFYVSLLGYDWQIPVADIPISFPITESNWIFDTQRVHFPLPDLAVDVTALDFGEVTVGESKSMQYQLWNAGEALAAASMTTSDPGVFPLFQTSAALAAGKTTQATVSFVPQDAGPFTGTLMVTSNDPNAPLQIVQLKGNAKEKPVPPPEPDAGAPPGETDTAVASEEGNCACRAAGESGGGSSGVAGLAVAVAALVMRRRRG